MKDSSFIWLLGYDADTTVASSTCSYDRYVHFGVPPLPLCLTEMFTIMTYSQVYSP